MNKADTAVPSKLPFKELKLSKSHHERVLFFDPTEVYARIVIDKYRRIQNLDLIEVFPIIGNGICSCGCGKKIEGRRIRWASEECHKFAEAVWAIIKGYANFHKTYLMLYYPEWECHCCGSNRQIEIDHIVEVRNGGGGCWLNNFQLLSKKCHSTKTAKNHHA